MLEFRTERQLNQRQETKMKIKFWAESPFAMLEDNEILKNMREISHEKEEKNLEDRYKRIRVRIMKPPYNKIIVLEVTGPSGTAKGTLLMNLKALIEQDGYLNQWLNSHSFKLRYISAPFAHAAEAVRLPQVGIVDPAQQGGSFSKESLSKISKFKWQLLNKYLLSVPIPDDQIIIFADESPGPAAYPVSYKRTTRVAGGADRANSVIYNFAFDPRTRDNLFVFCLDADEHVVERSLETRQVFDPSLDNFDHIFKEQRLKFIITDKFGNKHDVAELPIEIQRAVVVFLLKSMATPKAFTRSRDEMEKVKRSLKRRGLIKSLDIEDYYYFIQKRLQMSDNNFAIVQNNWVGAIHVYDLSYLIQHNLVVRLYPELLGDELANFCFK